MYLKIQKLDNNLILKAKNYFSSDFVDNLKNKSTFKESLVARYLISQKTWKEVYKNASLYYSSISHKKDLVFIWVSDYNIWVDIEIFKGRDTSLLDTFSDYEYELIWWKNWESFYVLWTSKESIIKYLWWNLEDINKYNLLKVEKINKNISWVFFNLKLIFNTNTWLINILSWNFEVFYYWVCFWN